MNRPIPFRLLAVLAAVACLAGFRAQAAERKPNVLFIAVNDLNHWVGYLGRNPQILTPNMDRLAIYPTLMDLCGLPTLAHVQGQSIRALLASPQIPWEQPAVTTYRQNNHTVRSEAWRYTHYSDGGEELYNEAKDPYEWTNLATQQPARVKEMADLLQRVRVSGSSRPR